MDCLDGKRKREIRDDGGTREGLMDCLDGKRKREIRDGGRNERAAEYEMKKREYIIQIRWQGDKVERVHLMMTKG